MATDRNLRLCLNFKNDRKKLKKRGQEGTKRDLEERRNGAKHRYKGRKERNIKKGTDKGWMRQRGILKQVNEIQEAKGT